MTATQQIDYEALAAALLTKVGSQPAYKAVSSTPTATYGHGQQTPGGVSGIFSYPGLEPDIVNAMVMPQLGLLDRLPSRTSIYDNPLYGIMTGVTDESGSEPTGVCDDPPTAGLMKLCTHAFYWGRFSRGTKVYDIDRFGRFRDRSDFNDLRLIGGPNMNNPNIPTMPGVSGAGAAVRSELAKALFEFATIWGRAFARLLYTGNPTNNTAGGGYKEPYGLDLLINDGYRDAVTGVACPASDSIVMDFGSKEINTNGNAFLDDFASIIWRLDYNASAMGLNPVTWAIVMTRSLWYEITEIWACAYSTYRCNSSYFSTSQVATIDTADTIRLRDEMRRGMFLRVDGRDIPVIIDDGITETPLAGSSFRSKIYIVPLRYVGSRPGIFLEYFNYDGPGAAMEAAQVFGKGSFYTTNGGRYLWHAKPPTNFCVQLLAKTEWRVILEVPQIAAVMENVKWTPRAHERSWNPDDSSFYVDGGGTSRTVDNSYFSPTS